MRFRRQAHTPPSPAARGTRPSPRALVIAALAGASSLLSFEPLGWWPLQFVSLAYLFYQVGM
jgi:apolipoprotein N-acyltransferase